MKDCPKCKTLLTEKSKEYVEESQKETNGFLFAELIKDIESLKLTEFERMVILKQINLIRYNCQSKIYYTKELFEFMDAKHH